MTALDNDLNETITSAVNARVEAAVAQALSGDEVVGMMVASAMNQEVDSSTYGRKKETFLAHKLRTTFQKMAQAAVEAAVEEQRDAVELAVRKEIRANINELAKAQVDDLVHNLKYKATLNIKSVEEQW